MRCISFLLSAIMGILLAQSVWAADLADFKIRVHLTKTRLTLTGLSGCDWKETSFETGDLKQALLVTESRVCVAGKGKPFAGDDFAFVLVPEADPTKNILPAFADGRTPFLNKARAPRVSFCAIHGTAWLSSSWSSTACVFVVDSCGVSPHGR